MTQAIKAQTGIFFIIELHKPEGKAVYRRLLVVVKCNA
jgi:hypothetical protein